MSEDNQEISEMRDLYLSVYRKAKDKYPVEYSTSVKYFARLMREGEHYTPIKDLRKYAPLKEVRCINVILRPSSRMSIPSTDELWYSDTDTEIDITAEHSITMKVRGSYVCDVCVSKDGAYSQTTYDDGTLSGVPFTFKGFHCVGFYDLEARSTGDEEVDKELEELLYPTSLDYFIENINQFMDL